MLENAQHFPGGIFPGHRQAGLLSTSTQRGFTLFSYMARKPPATQIRARACQKYVREDGTNPAGTLPRSELDSCEDTFRHKSRIAQ